MISLVLLRALRPLASRLVGITKRTTNNEFGCSLVAVSTGRQISNKKTGPGWISYLRMDALYTAVSSVYNDSLFSYFPVNSSCLYACPFSQALL